MLSYPERILLRFVDFHIKAILDNTATITYINSMGGRKSQCNQITRDLWVWRSTHYTRLTAIHIPGKQNVLADRIKGKAL